MIKKEKLPENILKLIPELRPYFDSNPHVVFAYLFGGLATGKVNPLSDVDIAVFLDDRVDSALARLDIIGELMKILKTDEIDLVILNSASLPLKGRVIKQGKILIDKKPFLRHKFESLSLREFFDFQIKEKAFFKMRYNLG